MTHGIGIAYFGLRMSKLAHLPTSPFEAEKTLSQRLIMRCVCEVKLQLKRHSAPKRGNNG